MGLFILFSRVDYSGDFGCMSKGEYVVHDIFEAKNRKEADEIEKTYTYPKLNDSLINSLNNNGYSINIEDNPEFTSGLYALKSTINIQLRAKTLLPAVLRYCERCDDPLMVEKIKGQVKHIYHNIKYTLDSDDLDRILLGYATD